MPLVEACESMQGCCCRVLEGIPQSPIVNTSAQVAPSAITTSVNLVSAGRQDSLS
ncbi:Uncharacterised protein [Chlamydia trachomatis]|nr:Uncharacterised protein [Chlamydia trachomatis]